MADPGYSDTPAATSESVAVEQKSRVLQALKGSASWFLMIAGKRWLVMPQVVDQPLEDLDHQLHDWLDAHAFPAAPPVLRTGRRP